MASVPSIHFCGDKVKVFPHASFLKESKSTPLNFGLFIVSQSHKNSMVFLDLSQFLMQSFGSLGFLYLAISVRLM